MDIESAARARMREREGYTYQQEHSFGVMKAAAENEGTGSDLMGASMGLGMGFGVGGVFGSGMNDIAKTTLGAFNNTAAAAPAAETVICPDCGTKCAKGSKFCLECGHKFTVASATCPGCGNAITPGAKFCPECGYKIATACPSCGNKLTPGSKFCPECGTKI